VYEYVQTAKGWVLYWGGAVLHQPKTVEAPVAAVAKTTPQPKTVEMRRPVLRAA